MRTSKPLLTFLHWFEERFRNLEGERTIINASIGIVGERFEAQLWARNLFDEQYVSGALVGQPNVQYNAYLGERQTYGLTITARLEDVANW